jgi:hypothetical protein
MTEIPKNVARKTAAPAQTLRLIRARSGSTEDPSPVGEVSVAVTALQGSETTR